MAGMWQQGSLWWGCNAFEGKSNGADVSCAGRSGLHSASIGGFYTNFQNYIALIQSGEVQEDLPEALYRPVKAEFYGFEMEGKSRIYEKKVILTLTCAATTFARRIVTRVSRCRVFRHAPWRGS